MFGTKKTDAAKQSFREKMLGVPLTPEHVFSIRVSHAIPVVTLKDDIVINAFLLLEHVPVSFGLSGQTINRATRSGRQKAGFIWKKITELNASQHQDAIDLLRQEHSDDVLKKCRHLG